MDESSWDERGHIFSEPFDGVRDRIEKFASDQMDDAFSKARDAFKKEVAEIEDDMMSNLRVGFCFADDGTLNLTISDEFGRYTKFISLRTVVDDLERAATDDEVDDTLPEGGSWIGNVRKALGALDTSSPPR